MDPQSKNEPESPGGSIWKSPYLLYVILTMVLFALLATVGWFAGQGDWIPKR